MNKKEKIIDYLHRLDAEEKEKCNLGLIADDDIRWVSPTATFEDLYNVLIRNEDVSSIWGFNPLYQEACFRQLELLYGDKSGLFRDLYYKHKQHTSYHFDTNTGIKCSDNVIFELSTSPYCEKELVNYYIKRNSPFPYGVQILDMRNISNVIDYTVYFRTRDEAFKFAKARKDNGECDDDK